MSSLSSNAQTTAPEGGQPQFNIYNTHQNKVPAKSINFTELCLVAETPRIGGKSNAPLITPFIAGGKTKKQADTALFWALVVDHDHDDLTEEALKAIYDQWGCAYLAFTTSSHQQQDERHPLAQNRWKVVIPLACAASVDQIAPIAQGLAFHFGADPAQARRQQGFYAPNKLTETAPYGYSINTDNQELDINDSDHPLIVAAFKAWVALQEEKQANAEAAPPQPRPQATGSTQAGVIGQVCERHKLGDVLAQHGYRKQGRAYLSPSSESGMAGVHVFTGDDGKERVFSHHGISDPLSAQNHDGHSLDVFDVICALEYVGNVSAAIRSLADDIDPEGQKERQREYMAAQEAANNPIADAPDKKPERPRLLVSVADLLREPAKLNWLIKGIVEHNTLTMLFGESGGGKSYVLLSMAASIATGRDWYGLSVRQGPVIYVAGEGHSGIKRRLKAWEAEYGTLSEAPLHVSGRSVPFNDALAFSQLRQEVAEMPCPPALIVIDTLARAAAGMDENSATEMGEFINRCDGLKHEFGCTVVIVHHTGLQEKGRARGSSAIYAALDVEIKLEKLGGECLKISCTKMKDGPEFKPMAFGFKVVALDWKDEEGEAIESSVLVLAEVSDNDMPAAKKLAGAKRIAMEALESCLASHTSQPPESLLKAYVDAPRCVSESDWRETCFTMGISEGEAESKQKAFKRARAGLMEANLVACRDDHYYKPKASK